MFQTAIDVAEYNVLSMFHEIATKTKYIAPEIAEEPKPADKQGPTITGMYKVQL